MSWPNLADYTDAVQNPESCFCDPELCGGTAAPGLLGPANWSGNFAIVYKVVCPSGDAWAVKCFFRQVADRQERYSTISKHLAEARLPFTVDFKYLEQGICVAGTWYPVLKMQWIEGLLLNDFVRDNLGKPARLQSLARVWLRMAQRLRDANLAHADLQHGNVILVPGSTANTVAIKLIDYDGMWVPALAGRPPNEAGHRNYQHPQRLAEVGYSADIDRFAHLAVYTALHALTQCGPALWKKYNNGTNLLFTEKDFTEPVRSMLFQELMNLPDPHLHSLVERLFLACQAPLETVPFLPELVEDPVCRDEMQTQRAARPAPPPTNRAEEPSLTADSLDWRDGADAPVQPLLPIIRAPVDRPADRVEGKQQRRAQPPTGEERFASAFLLDRRDEPAPRPQPAQSSIGAPAGRPPGRRKEQQKTPPRIKKPQPNPGASRKPVDAASSAGGWGLGRRIWTLSQTALWVALEAIEDLLLTALARVLSISGHDALVLFGLSLGLVQGFPLGCLFLGSCWAAWGLVGVLIGLVVAPLVLLRCVSRVRQQPDPFTGAMVVGLSVGVFLSFVVWLGLIIFDGPPPHMSQNTPPKSSTQTYRFKCKHCGHEWTMTGFGPAPRDCPKCRRPF